MRFRKTDIDTHTDNGYGAGYPAVNVKVHGRLGISTEDVMAKFNCSEEVAERALGFAWESECECFWEYWQDTSGGCENGLSGSPEYAYFPGYKVMVYSAGRSGGWLIVQGLPPVEEWDAVLVGRWYKFQRDVLADVKYRTSAEPLMEGIEANRWAEEHATSRFNFADTDRGTVCLADVKKDVSEYSMKKFGLVPCLP